MIVVTGATGHLGRLVVEELLKTTGANNIIAAARTPARRWPRRSRHSGAGSGLLAAGDTRDGL